MHPVPESLGAGAEVLPQICIIAKAVWRLVEENATEWAARQDQAAKENPDRELQLAVELRVAHAERNYLVCEPGTPFAYTTAGAREVVFALGQLAKPQTSTSPSGSQPQGQSSLSQPQSTPPGEPAKAD